MKNFPYEQPEQQPPRDALQPQSQRERVVTFIKASIPTATVAESFEDRLRDRLGWLQGSVLTIGIGQEGILQPVEAPSEDHSSSDERPSFGERVAGAVDAMDDAARQYKGGPFTRFYEDLLRPKDAKD